MRYCLPVLVIEEQDLAAGAAEQRLHLVHRQPILQKTNGPVCERDVAAPGMEGKDLAVVAAAGSAGPGRQRYAVETTARGYSGPAGVGAVCSNVVERIGPSASPLGCWAAGATCVDPDKWH